MVYAAASVETHPKMCLAYELADELAETGDSLTDISGPSLLVTEVVALER